MISLFGSVVSYVFLQACVREEHGNFVSGGDAEHRVRRDCMCCVAGASVGIGHAEVNVHLYPELPYRERSRVGRVPIAVGQRGATLAVVAVSSQFIVKSA